jgi:hypothetical protein
MPNSTKKLVSDVFSEAFGMQSTGEAQKTRETEPRQIKKTGENKSGNLASSLQI